MKRKLRLAMKWAKVIALLMVVAVVYYICSGVIYFAAGGTFGGYGAAPEAGDAKWQDPARSGLVLICIILVALIIRHAWQSRKNVED
jgi:hypothetical protein